VWRHAPQKILKNACSKIESGTFLGTKLLYAKDRLWKSAVGETSLAVHINFVFLKLIFRGVKSPS